MKRNDYHVDVGQLPWQISTRLQLKPSDAPGDINDKLTDVAQQAVSCWRSQLWDLLCAADSQKEAVRKPVSHYGSFPRRRGRDEANAWGDWVDPGNFHYTMILLFLELCAEAAGSKKRLYGLHAIQNQDKKWNRGGDICEAVLGAHIKAHLSKIMENPANPKSWDSERWNLNMQEGTQYAIARLILLHLSIQDLLAADGFVMPFNAGVEEQAAFIYDRVQPKMHHVNKWWGTGSSLSGRRSFAGHKKQLLRGQARMNARRPLQATSNSFCEVN